MAECKIPCKGEDVVDPPQECQTWLIYHSVVIMATICLAVYKEYDCCQHWCDKLRCALQNLMSALRQAEF